MIVAGKTVYADIIGGWMFGIKSTRFRPTKIEACKVDSTFNIWSKHAVDYLE